MLITTCLTALAATPLVLSEVPHQPGAKTHVQFAAASLIVEPATPAPLEAKAKSEKKPKFEEVHFTAEDDLKISGNFYSPKKKGRAPAALLIHDAGSKASDLSSVAENLQRKGFAVLAVDLRGHGASVSDGSDWSKITDLGEKTRTWVYAMRDLKAATNYLRDLDNVHNSNLSVVGVGAGAVLAAKYALNDENTRAVAVIEPQPEIYGYNMLRDVTALGGLPALIMTSDDGRSAANRIQSAAAKANGGDQYVKIQALKPKKAGDVFSDKRLNTELAKFLSDEAMDKR